MASAALSFLFTKTLACHTPVIAGTLSTHIVHHSSTISSVTVPQSGGTKSGGVSVSGNSIKIQHGSRGYFGNTSHCVDAFSPTMFLPIPLLDRTLEYTVDLNQASCGCNAALYLVSMPAHKQGGGYDPTKCGDYYCDANNVCGENCPEMDIMEANNRAWASTPHKCDNPQQGWYPSCDGGGCSRKVYSINPKAYGPGTEYTIDTQKSFEVKVTFSSSGGSFSKMTTVLSQSGKSITLTHDNSCGGGYLSALTNALKDGMVVVFSYWGDQGSGMSWLDVPPCQASENCKANTAFTLSNFRVS